MTSQVERREHKRLKVESNVLTCCRLDFPKVAEVLDISKDGLAFSYVGRAGPESVLLELDIVFPDGTGYLGKLLCKIVSDSEVGAGLRRSSAKFQRLSKSQRTKLAFFMQNYCVKELIPKTKS